MPCAEVGLLPRVVRLLTRPFASLSVISSGAFLAFLGFMPQLYFDKLPVGEVLFVGTTALVIVVSFGLGLALGRFLLRAFPLRADGRRRKGVITAGMLGGVGWLAAATGLFLAEPVPVSRDAEAFWLMSDVVGVRLGGCLMMVAWGLGALAPFTARHLAGAKVLDRPFVLFLRRFSSFSDRTVIGAVLQCCPAGTPVAFLTPTASAVRDWDPFRLGFAGMKLWRPLRSMPLDLRARDDAWETAATDLITRAQLIVLDTTAGSAAIEAEIDTIRRGGFAHKTIAVAQRSRANHLSSAEVSTLPPEIVVVRYDKTWRRAFVRLVLGLWATLLASAPLAWGAMMVFALVEGSWRAMQSAEGVGAALAQNKYVAIVVFAGLFAWVFFTLFVRPSIDRRSQKELASRLRGRRLVDARPHRGE